ncbi:MAG: sulfatase [Planctomycetes bacterium]|nr:sulfatase [Planctomycetota bacterium]
MISPGLRIGAAAALLFLAGCRDGSPPALVRADVTNAAPRLTPREAMLRERAGQAAILSDARDAWVLPVGATARIELAPAREQRLATAATVLVPAGEPRAGTVVLEARFEGRQPHAWRVEIDLAAGPGGWTDLAVAAGSAAGGGQLTLTSRWVGAPPPGAERARAAFEIPRRARARPDPAVGAPNVLVVTIDTLRADRLGCQGYERPTSPRIDALAAAGARFREAYSSAPWTLPAYGSLFTGRLPGEHRAGVVTERDALFALERDAPAKTTTEVLRADLPTLAEGFAAAGWSTAMFHNNPYLSRAAGVERGFDRYVRYESNARNGVDLALAWTAERQGTPWFLVLHLMDPHFPYAPPAPFDERFAGVSVDGLPAWPPNLAELRAGRPAEEVARLSSDLYDGEIAFTDEQVGRLLDGLAARGELTNTIVVIHSDHGEEFWEHGGADHGHAQHEELLRVPLVLVWPGQVPAGRVVAPRVRALDLFATLLDLAGLPIPAGVEARTLRPLLVGDEPPRRSIAEAIHGGAREIKAILDGAHKLVVRGEHARLHDLSNDPGERADVSSAQAQHVAALRALLLAHHGRSREAATRARALELDEASRDQLQRIGYGGADSTPPGRD